MDRLGHKKGFGFDAVFALGTEFRRFDGVAFQAV